MATTTQNIEIVAVARFADDDTRTITYPNPKADITSEEIQALSTAASKVLVGDKQGAAFTDFSSIKKREIVKTEYLY